MSFTPGAFERLIAITEAQALNLLAAEYPRLVRHEPLTVSFTLHRDPTNEYDANAIAVHLNGEHLGHLPKNAAWSIAGEMDAGVEWWVTDYVIRVDLEHPEHPGLTLTIERKP